MTLTDRAASLFGEIAVAAGVFEAQHGVKPRYVVLPPADAAALVEYVKASDTAVGHRPGPLTQTTRNTAKRALVSGLEVKVWAFARHIHVC
jgi:hypothetical protein